MKRIIICEGKTDALLISYLLQKRFGWAYDKGLSNNKSNILPVDWKTEVFNWYSHSNKQGQDTAIWGGNGINALDAKLGHIVNRTSSERIIEERFTHIVIFFDRDDRGVAECLSLVKTWLDEHKIRLVGAPVLGSWQEGEIDAQEKQPPETYRINLLVICVPPDGNGNLEIFLKNSLREYSAHDRLLVDSARTFIRDLPDAPYLEKRRLRNKACLGSVLSVISPDWVFSQLDNRLLLIPWEQLEGLFHAYAALQEL